MEGAQLIHASLLHKNRNGLFRQECATGCCLSFGFSYLSDLSAKHLHTKILNEYLAELDFLKIIYIIITRTILKRSYHTAMTKYAEKILELVESSRSHMTAEQVFELLRQTCPKVVLATVYNNLNRLCEQGYIRKISVEGAPDRYDRIVRHDHLVCKGCGRLLDIDLGDLTEQLERQAGIPILSYDLKLLYLCEECRCKHQKEGT